MLFKFILLYVIFGYFFLFHYEKIGVLQLVLQLGFSCNYELQRPLMTQCIFTT